MSKTKIVVSVLVVALVAGFVVYKFGPSKKGAPVKPPVRAKAAKKPAPKKAAPARPAAQEPAAPVREARLAIILDDWGYDYSPLDEIIETGLPVTLAILPHLPHSREIAEEAHASGLGVMLHMPMQPSVRRPLEAHTILTTSSDATVLRYLDAALASVPHAEGVNNHMGSAATSDERTMRLVLGRLKQKGLFFIDSQVVSGTVVRKVGEELGARVGKRDVFIDNENDVEYIKGQLRQAIRVAKKRGSAVAIGHDKDVTAEALAEMKSEFRASGVKLVYARELVA